MPKKPEDPPLPNPAVLFPGTTVAVQPGVGSLLAGIGTTISSPFFGLGRDDTNLGLFAGGLRLGEEKVDTRKIFVAHPYDKATLKDYRHVYEEVANAFGVEFVYADAKISDLHILEKISDMIDESAFGIYDITGWNANVTLELGLALGKEARAFLAFDPNKTNKADVPSDLKGRDRIGYTSFTELREGLTKLLQDIYPVPVNEEEAPLRRCRARLPGVLRAAGSKGLVIADIAKELHVSIDFAKLVVGGPLEADQIHTLGKKKGTKYLLGPKPKPIGQGTATVRTRATGTLMTSSAEDKKS